MDMTRDLKNAEAKIQELTAQYVLTYHAAHIVIMASFRLAVSADERDVQRNMIDSLKNDLRLKAIELQVRFSQHFRTTG